MIPNSLTVQNVIKSLVDVQRTVLLAFYGAL